MLSTKNIPDSKIPKNILPGNQLLKINKIELASGYNPGAYKVYLQTEGNEILGEFEGFFIDKDNETLGRHLGQTGRVRLSAFDFEDGTTKGGTKVYRDQSILKALKNLAKGIGKQEELDAIEVDTIEEFVAEASKVLASDKFYNFCIAGKEYENKEGFTNYDLFLPIPKDGKVPYSVLLDDSKLMTFDPILHIVKKIAPKAVESFETEGAGSFDL